MKLCKICNQRPAVVFVSKTDGNQVINEGYCLPCAIKSGITPVGQLAEQFGIQPSELEGMMQEMTEMMENGEMQEMLAGMFPGGNLMELPDEGDYPFKNEKIPLNDKKARQNIRNEKKKKKCLANYGVNLTEKAKQSLLDKVVGRTREIDRAIQILNRRSKNNPVLLGLPGVGKTAIAEGIAQRIAAGDVPEKLIGAQMWLLDLTAVVAGTQYRGQFESRLKNIVEEAKTDNTILVIDEIHSIVSAGDADGAMNAANILKPALSKGEIQIIGATTLDEYRKYVEKDAALERRFQPVIIDEPSREDTIRILQGVKEYYELYHNVTIDDPLICEVVDLSGKYITDRYQPDKSIDVIDEAASRVNMKNPYAKRIVALQAELAETDAQLEALEAETESPQYEEIARLKSDHCRIDGELQGLRSLQRQTKLTLDDIAQVIELWTGIPVKNITETDKEKLLHLEERLHKRLIGQDAAVQAVARAVRRNRALKLSKKRPVSFIFVGPTGVGKTELVKSLAESLFDDEKALIRMDMSEYMEKHAVSKIIGAPPGYVGYDEAGQLTEKVRRKPYSVILLDEIEKAHEDVFNILLQILDDGRITDSQGRVVNFENTIIIMTSNAGTSVGANSMGFLEGAGGSGGGAVSSKIDRALKEIFRPEFLNRIDEIVEFKPLTREELMQIIDLMLGDLKAELSHMNVGFAITDKAKERMLERAYHPKYGARPLRREIQTAIEDEVSTLLLSGALAAGQTVSVEAAPSGAITVKVK